MKYSTYVPSGLPSTGKSFNATSHGSTYLPMINLSRLLPRFNRISINETTAVSIWDLFCTILYYTSNYRKVFVSLESKKLKIR